MQSRSLSRFLSLRPYLLVTSVAVFTVLALTLTGRARQPNFFAAPSGASRLLGGLEKRLTKTRVSVRRRVARFTAPAAVIRTIKADPMLKRTVSIHGRRITPAARYGIFELTNGTMMVVGPTDDVSAYYQTFRDISWDIDGRPTSLWRICVCAGNLSGDDVCAFPPNNHNQCLNAQCCSLSCVFVDGAGNQSNVSCPAD